MKEFDNDTLQQGAEARSASPKARIFDRALLDRAEQELKRQYLRAASTRAEVQTTVTPLERNRVGVNFTVTEGEVAKIREINIVGNKAFTESELLRPVRAAHAGLAHLVHQERPVLARRSSPPTSRRCARYYLNRGYLEFTIDSTQVSISPDKQGHLHHGQHHRGRDVHGVRRQARRRAAGAARRSSRKLIQLKPGDMFSREKLTESHQGDHRRLGNTATRSPTSTPCPRSTSEKRTVAFTFFVDPAAASTCAASTSPATPTRATR